MYYVTRSENCQSVYDVFFFARLAKYCSLLNLKDISMAGALLMEGIFLFEKLTTHFL